MPVGLSAEREPAEALAPKGIGGLRAAWTAVRRGRPAQWLWSLAWAVTGGLALVALLRIVAWDVLQPLVLLDALTLLLYLPAWVIAVVALARRRWVLGALSVALVGLQLAFIGPELTAGSAVPANLRPVATIRLFDANVDQDNQDMSGYAREIIAFRPDVVVLEEANQPDQDQLRRAGALAGLDHVYQADDYGSRALLIASRWPLGAVTQSKVDGLPYLTRTSLALPAGPLSLWAVHTTAPTAPDWRDWGEELAGIDRALRAAPRRPIVLVGDFNATWGNRGFRTLLGDGFTDAAAARGDALTMTWSQRFVLFPPLVQIDHVLTDTGLVVTALQTEAGPGSDHRALTATVAVLPT